MKRLPALLATALLLHGLLLPLSAVAEDIPKDYKLIYSQDFSNDKALEDFVFSSPNVYSVVKAADGRKALHHGKGEKGKPETHNNYKPPHRSPYNIALLATHKFGSFVMDLEMQQTGHEYGHRDGCLFFNFVDPANFYYSHIATKSDPRAHQIMVVDDAPRTMISDFTTKGHDWKKPTDWHKVRLVRDLDSGKIEVYVNDMKKPIQTATDKTHGAGYIGFGSFDDEGSVTAIKIYAKDAKQEKASFFKPKK